MRNTNTISSKWIKIFFYFKLGITSEGWTNYKQPLLCRVCQKQQDLSVVEINQGIQQEEMVLKWCQTNNYILLRLSQNPIGFCNSVFLWMALYLREDLNNSGICSVEDLVLLLQPYWKREIVIAKARLTIKRQWKEQLQAVFQEDRPLEYLKNKPILEKALTAIKARFGIEMKMWSFFISPSPTELIVFQSKPNENKLNHDLLIPVHDFLEKIEIIKVF